MICWGAGQWSLKHRNLISICRHFLPFQPSDAFAFWHQKGPMFLAGWHIPLSPEPSIAFFKEEFEFSAISAPTASFILVTLKIHLNMLQSSTSEMEQNLCGLPSGFPLSARVNELISSAQLRFFPMTKHPKSREDDSKMLQIRWCIIRSSYFGARKIYLYKTGS